MSTTNARGSFATRFGFLMAAAGSAVGLGNIWKFPYITGEYGGGAFVLVYLVCIAVVGLPLMYAELVIGRRGGKDVLGAIRDLTTKSERPGGRALAAVTGFMAVAAGFLILSFYSIVAGWAIHFLFVSLGIIPMEDGGGEPTFMKIYGSFKLSALWHTLFMGLTVFVVAGGVQKGIEWACSRLMPALVGLLLLLLAYVGVTGGLGESLTFLFAPDWSKLTPGAVSEALGHAFFTLSLGMGAMVTYGSYIGSDHGLVRDAITIALLDTFIALLAGAVIFAVVFDGGAQPAETVGLVFMLLPDLFAKIPGGAVVASTFFILLIFAALSSAISLLEVVVAYAVDELGIERKKAATGFGVAIWAVGLISAASSLKVAVPGFLAWALGSGDQAVFDILDNLTTRIMLPLGGLLIAIAAGWYLTKEDREAGFAIIDANPIFAKVWTFLIRFVTPALVVFVLLAKAEIIKL